MGKEVEIKTEGKKMTVTVTGDIDHHRAVGVRGMIDGAVIRDRPALLRLVLSGVDFMDSSGLGLIMGRYAMMQKMGGSVVLVDPTAAIMRILTLSGMDRLIPIEQGGVILPIPEEKKTEERKRKNARKNA